MEIIKLIYKEKKNNGGKVIIAPSSIIVDDTEMELIDRGYKMCTADNSYSYSIYYRNITTIRTMHEDIDFVKMYKNNDMMYYAENGTDFYNILNYVDCIYLISATIDDDIIRIGYTDSNDKYHCTNIKVYFDNIFGISKKHARNSIIYGIDYKLCDIRNKIFNIAKQKMILSKDKGVGYLDSSNPDIKDTIFNDEFMEDGDDLNKFINKSLKRIENILQKIII